VAPTVAAAQSHMFLYNILTKSSKRKHYEKQLFSAEQQVDANKTTLLISQLVCLSFFGKH
jgi:hypothetical protein